MTSAISDPVKDEIGDRYFGSAESKSRDAIAARELANSECLDLLWRAPWNAGVIAFKRAVEYIPIFFGVAHRRSPIFERYDLSRTQPEICLAIFGIAAVQVLSPVVLPSARSTF